MKIFFGACDIFARRIYVHAKIQYLHLLTAEDMQGKTEEEIEMMKLMGFATFDTTKVRAQGCATLCSHKVVQFVTKFAEFYNLT